MKATIVIWLKENWFKILAILFLLGALGSWPYSYYQLLRWVVFGVGAYSAYLAYKSENMGWVWVFGIIALLFNPIIPFYFSRGIWQLIDLVIAAIFIVFITLKNKIKN